MFVKENPDRKKKKKKNLKYRPEDTLERRVTYSLKTFLLPVKNEDDNIQFPPVYFCYFFVEFFTSQLNAKFSSQISQAINQIKKFGPDFEKSLSNKPMMVFLNYI